MIDRFLPICLQMESGKSLVKVEGEEPQGSGDQGEAMEVGFLCGKIGS
jgi:hypothetical protein